MRAYLLCVMALVAMGSAADAQTADTTCSRSTIHVNCRTQYNPATPSYNVWDGLRDLGAAAQRDRELRRQEATAEAFARADADIRRANEEADRIIAQQAEGDRLMAQMIASADRSVVLAEQDGRCEDVAQLMEAFKNSVSPRFCAPGRPKFYPQFERAETALASRILIKWAVNAYYGREEPQDHALAASYLRLAANQGSAGAQYRLALMYANGEGVKRNSVEARRLIQMSAAQGYSRAKDALAPLPSPAKTKVAGRKR